MIKKRISLTLLATVALFSAAFAQADSEMGSVAPTRTGQKKYSIPGSFVVEFGFNRPFNRPDSAFSLGFWGSRTLNVYYQHEMRILQSKFSFHPGAGFGFERYKLTNFYTLASEDDEVTLVPAYETYPGVRKSMIITNYFDILAEIRFTTNPDDPSRSFHAAIGGRAGYLFDALTKIKYKEDGEIKKVKNNQNFNLNQFRYGAFVKFGVGNLSLFANYNFSTVFEADKGPQQTDMNNFTVGISLSAF